MVSDANAGSDSDERREEKNEKCFASKCLSTTEEEIYNHSAEDKRIKTELKRFVFTLPKP